MSDPHSLSDNDTQVLPFDDWDRTGKSPTGDSPSFDGKIIARMPDLGSNGLARNTETSKKFYALWSRTRLFIVSGRWVPESARSFVGTRQQFFQRLTAFGGALLLCGLLFLLLDQNDKEPTNEPFNVAEILPENKGTLATQTAVLVQEVPKVPAVSSLESSNAPSNVSDIVHTTIPATDPAVVPNAVVSSSESKDAVWNRPESSSPWDVAAKQPPSTGGAPDIVAMSPMSPMPPVSPMPPMPISMPVSPFERQLVATPPPVRPPVDPFLQANQSHVSPGMTPMHERLENMVNTPLQDARSTSVAPPYYPPLVAVQGGVPVNFPHQQGHYGQYGSIPHNAAPSSNIPIPSGVSTLSPQNNVYPPQNPAASHFYSNPPQPYHRVY